MMAARPSVKEEDRGGYKRLFAHRRRLPPPLAAVSYLVPIEQTEHILWWREGGSMIIDLFPLAAEMLRTYGAGYRDEVI